METPELTPCPFCGSDHVRVFSGIIAPRGFRVWCEQCHTEGPLQPTRNEAAAKWNARADPVTFLAQDIYCSSCGELPSLDARWRWNGSTWEHKCGDVEAGYFPAVRKKSA